MLIATEHRTAPPSLSARDQLAALPPNDPIALAAAAIADSLGEVRSRPRLGIYQLCACKGVAFVAELAAEAHRVFSQGGLKTQRGRRRTLGGVYFKLAQDATGGRAEYSKLVPSNFTSRSDRRAFERACIAARVAAKAERQSRVGRMNDQRAAP